MQAWKLHGHVMPNAQVLSTTAPNLHQSFHNLEWGEVKFHQPGKTIMQKFIPLVTICSPQMKNCEPFLLLTILSYSWLLLCKKHPKSAFFISCLKNFEADIHKHWEIVSLNSEILIQPLGVQNQLKTLSRIGFSSRGQLSLVWYTYHFIWNPAKI